MKKSRYESLAARLDQFAGNMPKTYRFNVLALSLLGYAYIFFVLGFLTLVLMALLAVAVKGKGLVLVAKLGIPVVILAWTIVRSLFASVSAPEGIELKQADAPELFATIRDLREKLRTPRIKKVLVDTGFNASITQIPVLGFIWNRNYLMLGLPYMMGSTAGQFTATLAHELGHISRAHGRFGYWVFRTQHTWNTLLSTLEESERWGAILFRSFFRWYAPYFKAYALAASRLHEFEADSMAAMAASARDNGEDLLNMEVRGYMYENEFWPALSRRAASEPEPPFPYSELQEFMKAAPDPDTAKWLIDNAMKRQSDSTSTHPTLPQRLEAMGVEPQLPPSIDISAAEHFLPFATVTKLVAAYDAEWRGWAADDWQQMGEDQRANSGRITSLTEIAEKGEATAHELMELAERQEGLDNMHAAVSAYREAAKLDSGNADIHYNLGRILLGGRLEEGVEHMERVIELEPEYSVMAMERICSFLAAEGREEEAQRCHGRLERQRVLIEEFEQEGNTLTANDAFVRPVVAPDEMEMMISGLAGLEGLRQAHVALKHSRLIEGHIYHIVGLLPARGSAQKHTSLLDHVAQEVLFPFDAKLFLMNYQNKKTRRAFMDAAVSITGTE